MTLNARLVIRSLAYAGGAIVGFALGGASVAIAWLAGASVFVFPMEVDETPFVSPRDNG